MTQYYAYLGTIEDPIATGATRESCIARAISEIRAQGGIGDEPHQWSTEDDAVQSLDIVEH